MQERTSTFGHPQSEVETGRELADLGIALDDTGDTITATISRRPWMSDDQWRAMRDGMLAHLEAEGFVREVTR